MGERVVEVEAIEQLVKYVLEMGKEELGTAELVVLDETIAAAREGLKAEPGNRGLGQNLCDFLEARRRVLVDRQKLMMEYAEALGSVLNAAMK